MRLSVAAILVTAVTLAHGDGTFAQVNARIADIAQFKGARVNRLQAMGLVVGLAGTGDSGDYTRMIEPLANLLKHYANPPNDLSELEDTKNVAIVWIQAELPEQGVREGDRLDVYVSATGNCQSLDGGRLISTPMQHHSLVDDTIIGFAMGPLEMHDSASAVNAVIRDGLVLEESVLTSFIASGSELASDFSSVWIRADQHYVTLVIDDGHAGFGMAASISEAINADLGLSFGDNQLALAMDSKNVLVRIPEVQISDPVPWLRDIETLTPLLPERGARVLINRSKGVIAVDGEVRISPVVFSVGGLTINIVRTPDGDVQQPAVRTERFVAVDPSSQGGANLRALIDQLNQINVPVEDQIAVIDSLHRMGNIHARIFYED